MKNFEFEHEGEKYWYSRSVAAAVALIAFRDNIPHLLIVQRGPNATYPGKWCIPGGFLEHDEYIYDCAQRELFEETGISLQPSKDEDPLTIVGIIDDPKTSTKQNVVFVYKIIRGNAMGEELSLSNAEPGEIQDVKWIPISEFESIDWAFNGAYQSELRKLLKYYIKQKHTVMSKLNLIDPDKSDIKYEVITFNDGQPHIKFQPLDRKSLSTDDITIVCRLATQDQLFILEQAVSVLRRHGLRIHTLLITYLQGMRMDRVMNFEEPFSLELIAARINAMSAERVCIVEPHSSVTMKLISHSESISLLNPDTFNKYFIVAPDAGARQRLGEEHKKANPGSAIVGMILREDLIPIAFCNKHRDSSTGYIDRLDIDESCVEKLKSNRKPILVVDDLCDGGRTFVLCAEAIRRVLPDAEIAIMVTHMVNPKGIEVLSQNYQRVVITNSFRDWQNEQLPDNVTCASVPFE